MRRKLFSGGSRERVLIAGAPADTERLLGGMSDEQRAEILGIAEIEGGDVDKGREVSPRHSILSIMLGARAKS